jgi:hypothetical protein
MMSIYIYIYIFSQERANEEGIKMPATIPQAKPQKKKKKRKAMFLFNEFD